MNDSASAYRTKTPAGAAATMHLREAARRFASVDVGDPPRPVIWTLVEW